MIYGRRKWLYGALVMVARDAARHFVRVKNPRGSSGSWRQLVLRWRRLHKRREHVSTSHAAIGARVFWFPQFHFHFATQRNDRRRHGPPANRVNLTGRPFLLFKSLRGGSDAGATNMPRSLWTSGHSIMGLIGGRPRLSEAGRIPVHVRADNPGDQRIALVNHSQIRHHWLQIFGRHSPAPGDLISSSRKDHKPQSVQFDRTEELVWRRARHPSTEVAGPESRQEFSNSYAQAPLRSFQSEEAAHTPTSFAQPAVQQITKLDPSVLDRLTDDVIRKVEQRVRIERERRGL